MRLSRLPRSFRPARRAFTLLEIILALGIGALLLAGLYYALNIQVGQTHSGRKIVQRSALARGILNRIQADILASLGPTDPNFSQPGGANAAASAGSTASATATTSSSTTPSTTSGASMGTSTAGGSSGSGSAGPSNPTTFNMGVQGTSTQLSIYASRLPREAIQSLNTNAVNNGNANQPATPPSDLRLITYWLATSGRGGLARQEVTAVTSADAINNLPPNVGDETQYLIHPEVVSLQFQYFDGTTWQDSWDGTQPGSDGSTPQGPPAAIAVTLSITQPSGRPQGGQAANTSAPSYQFRHVVIIPTANSYVAPATSSTPAASSSPTGGN